jgi:hypothetical protein
MWIAMLHVHAHDMFRQEYYTRRNAEAPVVGGLLFARNFHAHDLAVDTDEIAFTFGRVRLFSASSGRPSPQSARRPFDVALRWVAFAELPQTGKREHGRDLMYRDNVELRPLTDPIDEARVWLRDLF